MTARAVAAGLFCRESVLSGVTEALRVGQAAFQELQALLQLVAGAGQGLAGFAGGGALLHQAQLVTQAGRAVAHRPQHVGFGQGGGQVEGLAGLLLPACQGRFRGDDAGFGQAGHFLDAGLGQFVQQGQPRCGVGASARRRSSVRVLTG